ncbi:hypothetical protein QE152_g15555 [Popillia japonica]|uniref:C2H2-type domain-containing protein n=1 Tax=Popillia japonica TaxID=7064 RepID=A0AAW1L568_POPJA
MYFVCCIEDNDGDYTSSTKTEIYQCALCHVTYRRKNSYYLHVRYFCGKEPKFLCPIANCNYKGKLKQQVKQHLVGLHKLAKIQMNNMEIKKLD